MIDPGRERTFQNIISKIISLDSHFNSFQQKYLYGAFVFLCWFVILQCCVCFTSLKRVISASSGAETQPEGFAQSDQ